MRFAAPLGLSALLLIAPLTVWYVLKARRPRVEVSSTFLWHQQGESVTAATPWQRLRPDATFWLVLAGIVVLALALARPWRPVPATLGEHTVMILDASASMLADEGGPTRLELARRQARELVAAMGEGQTISVIEAGDRARVVTSSATDSRKAERAIDSVRPGQGRADLTGAFTLAESVRQPSQPTLGYLFTDRVLDPLEAAAAPRGIGVVPVGTALGNVAVTQLQTTPTSAETAQVFASVRNFGRDPVQATVRIATDDTELASRTVDIAGRETAEVVIDINVSERELIRGSVVAVADERPSSSESGEGAADGVRHTVNALSIDDTAIAVATGTREVTALVAGPGNIFVESALAAVEGVTVTTSETVPEDLTGVDVLVVDRVPAPEVPSVPTMLLAATVIPPDIAAAPAVRRPVISYQHPDHPLLQGVDLSDVALAAARPATPAASATADAMEPIVAGPAGTLVLAGRLGGQPVIYVGFDLLASNLPLDVSWPVLVSNSMSWLTGADEVPALRVGESLRVDLPAGIAAAEARSPSGDVRMIDASQPLVRTDEVGVWQVRWHGEQEQIEAAEEAPVVGVNAVIDEGDLLVEPPDAAAPALVGAGQAPPTGRRFVGPGLLTVLLVILVVDWVVAHRRELGLHRRPASRQQRGRRAA